MSLDLFLVVIDNTGAAVTGSSQVDRLSNPFRANAAVSKPFAVLSYSFGADATVAGSGGAAVGKVDMGELVVEMSDDANAATLFRYLSIGKRFRSVDVLARVNGERPAVVAGVGISTAVLTGLSWGVSGGGLNRRLTFDGQVFSVGSATQKVDGTYTAFTIASYDVTGGPAG